MYPAALANGRSPSRHHIQSEEWGRRKGLYAGRPLSRAVGEGVGPETTRDRKDDSAGWQRRNASR